MLTDKVVLQLERQPVIKYKEIEGVNGAFSIHKGNLRSIAVLLKDQSLCVVSPIPGLPSTAYESLEAIGRVGHVLAPNHYHNKGISEFVALYPKARAYATEAAAGRLYEQTKIEFSSIKRLKKLLNKDTSFLEPEGLKTGEVWLRLKDSELTVWVVTDAFCGPKLKRLATEAKMPELLKTFPNYGVADKGVYSLWAGKQVSKDNPTLLIPCHGSIVRSPSLAKSLKALLQKLGS